MQSALDGFCLIMKCCLLWEESLQYFEETEKSKIIGVKACMESLDFLFGLSYVATTTQ